MYVRTASAPAATLQCGTQIWMCPRPRHPSGAGQSRSERLDVWPKPALDTFFLTRNSSSVSDLGRWALPGMLKHVWGGWSLTRAPTSFFGQPSIPAVKPAEMHCSGLPAANYAPWFCCPGGLFFKWFKTYSKYSPSHSLLRTRLPNGGQNWIMPGTAHPRWDARVGQREGVIPMNFQAVCGKPQVLWCTAVPSWWTDLSSSFW